MKTSSRGILRPFSMMSVRSWPARPTKASPCSSSSAPGASPTNMRRPADCPGRRRSFLRPAGQAAALAVADSSRARLRESATAAPSGASTGAAAGRGRGASSCGSRGGPAAAAPAPPPARRAARHAHVGQRREVARALAQVGRSPARHRRARRAGFSTGASPRPQRERRGPRCGRPAPACSSAAAPSPPPRR